MPLTGQDRPESISDIGVIVESEYGIGLRHGLGQLVTVALCQTSDGDDGLCAASPLEVASGEQRVDRVLLRRLDEAAGIDHQRVRRSRVGDQSEIIALESGGEFLRVNLITRTTEGDQMHRGRLRALVGA